VRGVEVGEPVIVGEAAGALAPGMRVRVVSEETAGAAGPAS
jgi:hypothetical protein